MKVPSTLTVVVLSRLFLGSVFLAGGATDVDEELAAVAAEAGAFKRADGAGVPERLGSALTVRSLP